MPKSKRNKVVPLTKVKKRGMEAKEELVAKIQEAFEKFEFAYVVSFENMRSVPFKSMQTELR